MMKTHSAGGVVTNNQGKVLVVSQRGTSWSLPKGHIDPGESALAAAKREIYEESGIRDLELIRELGTRMNATRSAWMAAMIPPSSKPSRCFSSERAKNH